MNASDIFIIVSSGILGFLIASILHLHSRVKRAEKFAGAASEFMVMVSKREAQRVLMESKLIEIFEDESERPEA